ncbi:MAG: hypothetical protein IJ400_00680 [Clostridia bacterium]|nr:hypothetical protein [Clostridia bacterium]
MKKIGQFIFNVVWALTVGLASAISSGITGIALCITIIGIPLGLQHFKFVKLIFAPAGKVVALKYNEHPVLNTLWLIFGGFELFTVYMVLVVIFAITIVGIPIAKQLYKIACFYAAPFGCEIVKENEYTSTKNTRHDFNLLEKRICANPNKVMSTAIDESGVEKVVTVKQWLAEKNEEDKKIKATKVGKFKERIIVFVIMVVILVLIGGLGLLISWIVNDSSIPSESVSFIIMGIFFGGFLTIVYLAFFLSHLEFTYEDKMLSPLFDLYPNGSPYVSSFKGYTFLVRLGIEPYDNGYIKKYMAFTEEELKKLIRDGDK